MKYYLPLFKLIIMITIKDSGFIMVNGYTFVKSSKPIEPGDTILNREDGITGIVMDNYSNKTLIVDMGEDDPTNIPVDNAYRLILFNPMNN